MAEWPPLATGLGANSCRAFCPVLFDKCPPPCPSERGTLVRVLKAVDIPSPSRITLTLRDHCISVRADPPSPAVTHCGPPHDFFSIIFWMLIQDASVSIFGSKIVATWTPKSSQIAPKSKPTTAAEAIGKKIDFETHFGTIFHRFLVDFGDHFCCRPHRFAKLSCEAAKSKNYGKTQGSASKMTSPQV